jgi:hypothetical protein
MHRAIPAIAFALSCLGSGPVHYIEKSGPEPMPTLNGFPMPRTRGKHRTTPHAWGTRQRRAAKMRRRLA